MAITSGLVTIAAERKQIKAISGTGRSVLLYADSANTGTVWIGGKEETAESGKGFPLPKGTSIAIDLSDMGLLYCFGTAADKLYWIANGNTL